MFKTTKLTSMKWFLWKPTSSHMNSIDLIESSCPVKPNLPNFKTVYGGKKPAWDYQSECVKWVKAVFPPSNCSLTMSYQYSLLKDNETCVCPSSVEDVKGPVFGINLELWALTLYLQREWVPIRVVFLQYPERTNQTLASCCWHCSFSFILGRREWGEGYLVRCKCYSIKTVTFQSKLYGHECKM